MKIAIINGPNLNLLGKREPEIYGNEAIENLLNQLEKQFPRITFHYFQTNVEGELQRVGFSFDGIVLNPAAYTHTSVAIADAVAAISTPVIEVHISNIYSREDFRKISFVSPNAIGVISGLGLKGYELAVEYLVTKLSK